MEINPNNLTPQSLVFTLFSFTALISPGYIYFYLYHPALFLSIDWIKLIILSVGITSPFFIVNFGLYSLVLTPKSKDPKIKFEEAIADLPNIINASWVTLLLFYISFVPAYFKLKYCKSELNTGDFFAVLLFAEIFYITVLAILNRRSSNRK